MESSSYDILIVSDFRLSGMAASSLVEEIKAQADAGCRTGLLQCVSGPMRDPRPWNDAVLALIEPGVVDVIPPGGEVTAALVVARPPAVLNGLVDLSTAVETAAVVVVADQVIRGADGVEHYNPDEIGRIVEAFFGVEAVWAPTGPAVRDGLVLESSSLELLAWDWTSIFAQPKLGAVREGFNVDRPVIGRHSTPDANEWPSRAGDIEAAYPSSGDFEVRILGDVEPVKTLVGSVPSNWEVVDAEVGPFLDSLNFWVYFHSDGWEETQGQMILEALGAGLVVILPRYLESTFGDAALYGRPQDVTYLIRQFANGRLDYKEQSAKALRFASSSDAGLHLKRLVSLQNTPFSAAGVGPLGLREGVELVGRRIPIPPAATWSYYTPKANLPSANRVPTLESKPVVLVVTSETAETGQVSRMLGVARAGRELFDTVFASTSQEVPLVERFGFRYEYIPGETNSGASSGDWEKYFAERLEIAVQTLQPDAVFFEGARPRDALIEVLGGFPDPTRIWMRQGMTGRGAEVVDPRIAKSFDLILQPDDYAGGRDDGAVKSGCDSVRVSPLTVLGRSETLTREDARRELGLDEKDSLALISLGAERVGGSEPLWRRVVEAVDSWQTWTPVVAVPPGSGGAILGAGSISYFPLARYLRAFDFAVSVAGYSAFAEHIGLAVPTIWVQDSRAMTDDQKARASWAEESGAGIFVAYSDWTAMKEALALMADKEVRDRFERDCRRVARPNGARQAALLVAAAIESRRSTAFGEREWRK